ncbi:resolvase [Bacillus cereus]|nr:resolvase [Bacillus cereus]
MKIHSLTEYGCKSELKTGRELGRPKIEKEKLSSALRMCDSNKCSIKEIIEGIGISLVLLYQAINKRKFKETQK